MQRHLDEGCEKCFHMYSLWNAVGEVASREPGYEFDVEGLQAARAAYAEWRLRYFIPRGARLATLVFDSSMEPLPAGVRTGAVAQRRLVHRLSGWVIDLQLEPEAGDRLSLAGQVLRSGTGTAPGSAPRILVMSDENVVAETAANEFGEFNLSFGQMPGLRLYVDIPGQRPIAVPLTDDSGRPDRGSPERQQE